MDVANVVDNLFELFEHMGRAASWNFYDALLVGLLRDQAGSATTAFDSGPSTPSGRNFVKRHGVRSAAIYLLIEDLTFILP